MRDRTELFGIVLLICAIVLMFNMNKRQVDVSQSTPDAAQSALVEYTSVADTQGNFPAQHRPLETSKDSSSSQESIFILKNDVLTVKISDIGGTIRSIELNKYQAAQDKPDPVVFNGGNATDALSISSENQEFSKKLQQEKFEVISANETSIALSKSFGDGCQVVRTYSLGDNQAGGYVFAHETRIVNDSPAYYPVNAISLFLGAMPPTSSDVSQEHLNFGMFNGKKDFFVKLRDFKASNGFFGLGKRPTRQKIFSNEKTVWGAIKNQFFAAVLTPEVPADGYVACPIKLNNSITETVEEGMAGALLFNIGTLAPGEQRSIHSKIYVGPKDFSKLSSLGNEQDRVMQFGFFGSISELLLRLMLKIHSVVPNWGWTIVILTTIIKLLLWPLTNAQVRSSKKMAAIQQPLKLLKEKFKNNPKKLQAETLKLFKENQVNPAAGCLPIFIQIPIFFGLYYMLRSSSDLRFAHFLWIKDLSLPDTIAHIGRFPVNILPLIMGVTMFYQMHMNPMPSTNNSQKTIFKLMPAIFMLCCYNFPSGLVLYWSVQNLLTIIQQLPMLRSASAQGQPSESVVADRKKTPRRGSAKKQRRN